MTTKTTRAPRKAKATFLLPRPELSETVAATETGRMLAAASVAMALMRKAKVSTIDELAAAPDRIPASVRASPQVIADIERFADVLAALYVPLTGVEGAPAARYLAACPVCGRWLMLSGGTPPTKCSLTLGCPGKPVKASAATAPKVPTLTSPGHEGALRPVDDLEDDDETSAAPENF